MKTNSHAFRIVKMAKVLEVSASGYYAWLKRAPSKRAIENKQLGIEIERIFYKSRRSYGSRKIQKTLLREENKNVGLKRVISIMRKHDLKSKVRRKYKATTNSAHHLPVSDNILNRRFEATEPKQKLVSDITYIPTDEGWLYLAAVMDLCGRRIVGASMDERMTKDLVCNALTDAVNRTGRSDGGILHSDRGSQYCSEAYRSLASSFGFISSMSRTGNCWDNAPMESFWGKLKQEWLNEQHFKTRAEAKSAVFEYIWIFYNRQRLNAAIGYSTPDEYYARACA